MSDARVGLMLYTVRDASARLEGTLRAVAELGFDGVELFDLHGHAPRRSRAGSTRSASSRSPVTRGSKRSRRARRSRRRCATLGSTGSSAWIEPDRARPRPRSAPRRSPQPRPRGPGSTSATTTTTARSRGLPRPPAARRVPRARPRLGLAGGRRSVELLGRAGPLVHIKDFRARGARAFGRSATATSATSGSRRPRSTAGAEWLLVEQDETDGPGSDAAERSLAGGAARCSGRPREGRHRRLRRDQPHLRGGRGRLRRVRARRLRGSRPRRPIALAEDERAARGAVDELLAEPTSTSCSTSRRRSRTPPSRAALAAGKHVYSEKPLAIELGRRARARRARPSASGCASAARPTSSRRRLPGRARADRRGRDRRAGLGQRRDARRRPESWHPNPDIFYPDGAGPLLDMGPYYLTAIVALLGPVGGSSGFASLRTASARSDRPARRRAIRGVDADARVARRWSSRAACGEPRRELRGDRASTSATWRSTAARACSRCPTRTRSAARCRCGAVAASGRRCRMRSRGARDTRGLGLDEMVQAIREDRPHRASGLLGAHVVEVVRAILEAAREGRTVEIESRVAVPAPMPVGAEAPDVAHS